jgi:Na+/H+ antiporter NhaD/arsenite permease-like protein
MPAVMSLTSRVLMSPHCPTHYFGCTSFFFVHHTFHISPSFIAVSAAAVALIWVQPDIQETFKKVEWSVLIFFSALFVWLAVGGGWCLMPLSAFEKPSRCLVRGQPDLDRRRFRRRQCSQRCIDSGHQGLGDATWISRLWWALAFGAGFGGNGTIIGSTANIIVASLSEKTRTPITSRIWNRRGLPVMLATCVIASILFVIFYNTF